MCSFWTWKLICFTTKRKDGRFWSCYVHLTENSKQTFPEMKLPDIVPNLYIHESVSDSHDPPILLSCVCGPVVGIYKSLTDT
jgi:hypothetical protein